MSKYKHLISGLLIVSLYFINTKIINFGIDKYVVYKINHSTTDQILDFLVNNQTVDQINLSYYTLVFKTMFFVYIIITILIVTVYHKKLKAKISGCYTNRVQIMKRLCLYVGVLLGLTAGIYLINIFIFPQMSDYIGENQSIINTVLLGNLNPYIVIVVVILSPIVEEFIFRYGLINNLLKNRNIIIQVLVSSIIFSFIHIGLAQMTLSITYFGHLLLLYMPMSIVYSYVYVKERNIVFPLSLHVLNNIGSIIIVFMFK